jgi:hypothetical protein
MHAARGASISGASLLSSSLRRVGILGRKTIMQQPAASCDAAYDKASRHSHLYQGLEYLAVAPTLMKALCSRIRCVTKQSVGMGVLSEYSPA